MPPPLPSVESLLAAEFRREKIMKENSCQKEDGKEGYKWLELLLVVGCGIKTSSQAISLQIKKRMNQEK